MKSSLFTAAGLLFNQVSASGGFFRPGLYPERMVNWRDNMPAGVDFVNPTALMQNRPCIHGRAIEVANPEKKIHGAVWIIETSSNNPPIKTWFMNQS
jgi:hypothetical protein